VIVSDMNTSLTRSIGFWLLVVLSLASAAVGGWIISGQLATMTTTLLDGTATGVEVYVGQSLVVVGAALVGAGVLGILIALALTAVRSMIPRTPQVAVEAIDWTAQTVEPSALSTETVDASADGLASADEPSDTPAEATHPESDVETTDDEDAQNGSSGSIATATKINVK
jgi:UPF0716 family protein affecting phage T7 exclusion